MGECAHQKAINTSKIGRGDHCALVQISEICNYWILAYYYEEAFLSLVFETNQAKVSIVKEKRGVINEDQIEVVKIKATETV